MKRHYKQKELIDLLEDNPMKIKTFFNEARPGNRSAYIFLDAIVDRPISYDNIADYVNNVQIQIYAKDIDVMNKTLKYIKRLFVATIDRYKEDHYNVAVLNVDLFISDWNG